MTLDDRNRRFVELFSLLIFSAFNTSFIYSQSFFKKELSIDTIISKSINYLRFSQYQNTDSSNFHFKGEWISTMSLETNFILLGKKNKKHEDSNCFTVGTIHNSLARIYLTDTSRKELLEMMDLAFPRILSYKNGDCYNFWNLLHPQIQINPFKTMDEQKLVRRPTHFPLENKYVNKAANILEDADDTSIGYSAEYYHSLIHTKDTTKLDTKETVKLFDQYRDLNRNNRHWYNHSHGYDNNTGAYLTWFGEEYQFRNWNIFKDMFHNVFYFLPFSQAFPFMEKPYLPFGSNDIDAVVNANILQLISLLNQAGKGTTSSVKFIERKILKGKFDFAAAYYPNRYSVGYAVSRAYREGAISLQKSVDACVQMILETQEKDGGWSSRKSINQGDRIQSTLYAISTLLQADILTKKRYQCEIEKGIEFILSKAIKDGEHIHWEGGVFFSGGTMIRKTLFWKSDALTTTLIVEMLVNFQKLIRTTDE